MAALPTPHTTTDMLLTALHEEIVGLRADLADARGGERKPAGRKPAAGETVLEEPATSSGSPAKRTARRKP